MGSRIAPAPSGALGRELELEETDFRERARSGLLNFTLYTKRDFEISWHHRIICRYLNAFIHGQIPRLLIMAPPRHGKSELVSRRLPALLLGQNPDLNIISATYNAKFAARLNRDVQRILTSSEYRELFPGVRLNERNIRTVADGSWLRNSEMFEIVGRKGYYLCAGIGGSLTGSGGDVALIDDPVKDWKSAISDTERENIWEWYSSVLYTRLSKLGRVCLTLTRWHQDDLAGRLEERMKSDPDADQWTILRLPAIKEGSDSESPDDHREVGEPLWPERFPATRLLRMKALNEMVFVSLYQQRPAPPEGNIIKMAWWKRFKTWPNLSALDDVILSIDLPFKRKVKSKGKGGSDFATFQVWGRRGPDAYLLHQARGRMGFGEQLETATRVLKRFPQIIGKLVEAKANGEALIDQLRSRVPGLIAVNPVTDKINRAWAVSPLVRAGNVWLPDESLAPWVAEFIAEWAVFPAGANDDQCFVAGTMVATVRGDVPVEKLRKGDRLLTPLGVGVVEQVMSREVEGVVTRCGLTGTANHPVITKHGLRPLDTCSQGEVYRLGWISQIQWAARTWSLSRASFIGGWEAREAIISRSQRGMPKERKQKGFTSQSGNVSMAQRCRQASSCIMWTAIHSTTALITFAAYRCANIGSIMAAAGKRTAERTKSIWIQSGIWRRSGIAQRRATHGTGSMDAKALRKGSAWDFAARCAVHHLSRCIKMLDSAVTTAMSNGGHEMSAYWQRAYASSAASHSRSASRNRALAPNEERAGAHVRTGCSDAKRQALSHDLKKGSAPHAASDSGPTAERRDTAPRHAPPRDKSRVVYNLTSSHGVYYANGVLVSNCDATTQALLYWFGGTTHIGVAPMSFEKVSGWTGSDNRENSRPWLSPAEDDSDVARSIALR